MRTNILLASLAIGLVAAGCSKPEIDDKPAAKVEAAPAEADKAAKPAEAAKDEEKAEPAAATAKDEVVKVDAATSKIAFIGAKVTGIHNGGFKTFDGTATVADGKAKSASFTIDTNSIFTDAEKLTGHLKSPDFFDVAKFPKAAFESSAIKEGADAGATHTITGTLEMRGVKKQITFPATVKVEAAKVSAKAEFKINRKDWGIVYAGMPDDLIKDDVAIILDLSFPRGK